MVMRHSSASEKNNRICEMFCMTVSVSSNDGDDMVVHCGFIIIITWYF